MTSSTTASPASTKAEAVTGTALYWYGTLPAIGNVKAKIHQSEYNETVDGYFTYGDTTAKKAWNGKHSQSWLGKCPDFQTLPVAGVTFNAWTERVVRQGDTSDYAKVPWPGGIIKLSPERYRQIVDESFRHIYRIDPASNKGKLIYLDIGKHPPIDPNDPMTKPLVVERLIMDKQTDTPVSEFIYLRKVFDLSAGQTEPKSDYYSQLIPTPLMDNFFDNPPPSIADEERAKKKG